MSQRIIHKGIATVLALVAAIFVANALYRPNVAGDRDQLLLVVVELALLAPIVSAIWIKTVSLKVFFGAVLCGWLAAFVFGVGLAVLANYADENAITDTDETILEVAGAVVACVAGFVTAKQIAKVGAQQQQALSVRLWGTKEVREVSPFARKARKVSRIAQAALLWLTGLCLIALLAWGYLTSH